MSLKLEHVNYRYPGSSHGLSDVSVDVSKGELLAVIGPSGSGKSTLLKLVAGLTTGHTGRILLDGKNVAGVPVHQRNIGMVFQNYALFPHLSVVDNVAYGLKLRNHEKTARHRRARELLELVGLGEFSSRAVGQLSGGQQQRVALARALAINPSALLLDEPLSALDAGVRGHLRDQIRQVQRRFGATTVLVTHDQEEALAMADRVAVLKDGALLQLATPRELYDRPINCDVARFVGLSTILPAVVDGFNKIDLGFARWAADTGLRGVGAKVNVLVRPEHVQPDPGIAAVNRVIGRRGTERFLGGVTRYDFLPAGSRQPILAEAGTPAQEAIAVAPDRILLLDA